MPSQTGSIDLTAQVAANANAKDYTDSVEIGGRNLYSLSASVPGYLSATGGIVAQSPTTLERTSDFIPVEASADYTLQFWDTANDSTNQMWTCLQWFDSGKAFVSQAVRGHDSDHHNYKWTLTAPSNAAYARVSARWQEKKKMPSHFALIKLEKGNKATDWSPAPEDVETDAQAKADAVQENLDNLEIGGRNLLRYTTKPSTTEWVGYGGNNTISRPGDEGLRITITGSGTHGIRVPLVADDCIADGEECMLSLDYRANVSSTGKIYLLCRTTPNVEHPAASITGDGEWHHLSMPISWSGMGDRVVFDLLIGYISGTGNYFEVRDGTLKLEKGNKATDWSPAPEDASESIGAVQDDLDTTKSSVVWEGLCSSTTGTAAKVVECPGFTSSNLVEGARIRVRFKNNNTAEAISLNVNGTGAIGVYVGGADTSASNVLLIAAGADVDFTYTGTRWRIANQPGTYYATCAIAAATAAKTASYNGAVIYKGTTVNVLMTYENTSASATFNFQGTGARAIYYGNTTTVPTAGNGYGWKAGETATLVFDGKLWRFATNTANAAKTATNYITDVSNDGIWITPSDAKPSSGQAVSTTSGWHISDAIELFRSGASYLKAWAEEGVAKIRIGLEGSHQLLTPGANTFYIDYAKRAEVGANGLTVYAGEAGSEVDVASFGQTSRIGPEDGVRTTIGSGKFEIADGANRSVTSIQSRNIHSYTEDGVTTNGLSYLALKVEGDGVKTGWTNDSPIFAVTSCYYDDDHSPLEIPSYTRGRYTFTFSQPPEARAFTINFYSTDLSYTIQLGTRSEALGQGAIMLGRQNAATRQYSVALGRDNVSSAADSYVLGRQSNATERDSYAIGRGLKASAQSQTVIGRFNEEDANGQFAFIVGGGESDSSRRTIFGIESGTGLIKSWNPGDTASDSGVVTTRTDTGVSLLVGVGQGGYNHGVHSSVINKWMIYANRDGHVLVDGVDMTGVDWTNLPLDSSKCEAYSSTQTPKYRRWGNVVNVRGAVKPLASYSASVDSNFHIGALPAGSRPNVQCVFLCQGSGTAVWMLEINTDGNMYAKRYRDYDGWQSFGNGTWFIFDVTFMV